MKIKDSFHEDRGGERVVTGVIIVLTLYVLGVLLSVGAVIKKVTCYDEAGKVVVCKPSYQTEYLKAVEWCKETKLSQFAYNSNIAICADTYMRYNYGGGK